MTQRKKALIVTNERPGRLIPGTKTVKTGMVEANRDQAENIVNNGDTMNSVITTTRAAKAAMKTEYVVTDKSNELNSVELVNKPNNEQREQEVA